MDNSAKCWTKQGHSGCFIYSTWSLKKEGSKDTIQNIFLNEARIKFSTILIECAIKQFKAGTTDWHKKKGIQWKLLCSCCKKSFKYNLFHKKRWIKKTQVKFSNFISFEKISLLFSSALARKKTFIFVKLNTKLYEKLQAILFLFKINVSMKINWTLPSVFQAYHRFHLVKERHFFLFNRKKSRREN